MPEAETIEAPATEAEFDGAEIDLGEIESFFNADTTEDTPDVTPEVKETPEEKPEAAAEEKPDETKADDTEEKPDAEEKPDEPEATDDTDDLEDLLVSDEEVPESVTKDGDKAVARWKELRAAEKEVPVLKAELEKLRAAGPSEDVTKTISTLTAENEKLRERVFIANFKESPEYEAEVAAPIIDGLTRVREIADSVEFEEGEEIDNFGEQVEDAILKGDRVKLRNLLRGIDAFDREEIRAESPAIATALRRAKEIEAHAAEKAREFDEAKTVETQQEIAERKTRERENSIVVLDALKKKVPELVDDKGNLKPEYKGIEDLVEKTSDELDQRALVVGKFAGPLLVSYIKSSRAQIAERDAKIAEHDKTIAALKGVKPGAGGGTTTTDEVEDDFDPLDIDINDLKKAIGG